MQRAWYIFLGLGLLTFIMTALIGTAPRTLSSAIALPHNLFYQASVNMRQAALDLADRRAFKAELGKLDSELAQLEVRNRELELEVARLQQILRVRQTQSSGVVMTAPVTGRSSSAVQDHLSLGRGQADGVIRNMPVSVPEGLVGIVAEVTRRGATVRAITDPESRVGVTVSERGGQGIVVGALGGQLRIINYLEDQPVQVGDVVETSSLGGLFPRGILVGQVRQVLPVDETSLRSSYLVTPAVDLSTLLEVALIQPQ